MSDFNPRNHLKKIKGKGDANAVDYLPPKWRVKWFREEYPEGSIVTEIVHFDEKAAVVKCTVTTPDGTVCVSHGHETANDHADYLMKAETKSIGRCLAIRGFGIEFSEDDDDKQEADPRDYKAMAPPQEERRPIEKAPGWPENAKPTPKQGQPQRPQPPKPTLPDGPAMASAAARNQAAEMNAQQSDPMLWAPRWVRDALDTDLLEFGQAPDIVAAQVHLRDKGNVEQDKLAPLFRYLFKLSGAPAVKGKGMGDLMPPQLIAALQTADDAELVMLRALAKEL